MAGLPPLLQQHFDRDNAPLIRYYLVLLVVLIPGNYFMSRLPRYAIIFVLSFGCAGLPSAVNSQTKAPKKVTGATVSGRVTTHGKGAPGIVVGARTQDYFQQAPPSYKATTDQDGFYRITDVPPGNYHVSPMAPAYVSSDRSALRDRGKLLLLAEGENVEGIDFSLERGGVITGRVTDADGRPVVEERLALVPADLVVQPGQRFASVVPNSFQTDDRGVYRIYGIPEGRYKLSIGQGDENNYTVGPPGRIPYKRTYYPEAENPNDARVIEVTEGGEVSDVDIRVGRSLPGFVVNGTVVDAETGRPVAGLRFGVRRALNSGFANINSTAPSNSQGEFRLENVTPGKYAVQILPLSGSEVRAEPVTFEVVDRDVSGIVVKTSVGMSINGTVVVEGKTDPSVFAKLTELRLRAFVRNESAPEAFGQSSPINPDGSFRLGGLGPGTAHLSLSSRDNRQLVNFAILRVERDGVVQPRGLEIKPGEQVTGVKVVLKYGTGSIRGEVKFENGPLPPGARVSVWITKPDEPTTTARSHGLDSRGHFLIEGVSAGTYELNVNANLPQSHKPPLIVKQTVTVTDGAVSDVTVTIDLLGRPETPVP